MKRLAGVTLGIMPALGGAIEEEWTSNDLGENFMVASAGSLPGTILTASLLIPGVRIFMPGGIFPGTLGAVVMGGHSRSARKRSCWR